MKGLQRNLNLPHATHCMLIKYHYIWFHHPCTLLGDYTDFPRKTSEKLLAWLACALCYYGNYNHWQGNALSVELLHIMFIIFYLILGNFIYTQCFRCWTFIFCMYVFCRYIGTRTSSTSYLACNCRLLVKISTIELRCKFVHGHDIFLLQTQFVSIECMPNTRMWVLVS